MSASEKRRVATELAAAQRSFGDMQSRISNMNSISAKTAKATAAERAEAQQKLLAEQELVTNLKVCLLGFCRIFIVCFAWLCNQN